MCNIFYFKNNVFYAVSKLYKFERIYIMINKFVYLKKLKKKQNSNIILIYKY